jgi:hypothetical protein
MGSIKKALKPVTRVVDNIIPNEIKPALPYLAASFGAPYLAGKGILGALGTGAFGKGVSASLINAATNAALGRKFNPVSAATSGIMAGGGQFLTDNFDSKLAQSAGKFLSPGAVGDMTLGQAAVASSGSLTAGSMQAAFEEAEKANREYDDYVRQQEEAGAADIQTRRDYITRYMGMAGFDQDQIDDALSRYGYKTGGRVGFAGGGTLGDSMQSMKILLMKNEIIESGKLGFDVKDIDTYSDDKIIEIYEGLFGQGNKNGGRIGYRIGGGPVKSFIAKLLNAEPSEEVMQRMVEERKKEILNEMFDPEAGTGAYSMQQMQEADEMATKQAMKELEEFKMRIGMEMKNPPEGSVGDDVIDQIMNARKKSNRTLGERTRKDILDHDFPIPMNVGDTLLDKFMLEDFQDRIKKQKEEQKEGNRFSDGGRIEYAEGGSSSTEQQKRENYFDLKRDEFMSLSEYLLSSMSDADLRSGKADGGIMNLNMGGMPAEMDLRGGGFVPLGAKEKADDVPARLSKNEFVMTADAVRAAGGGSVNKGAKRMYDLMNKLEAKV